MFHYYKINIATGVFLNTNLFLTPKIVLKTYLLHRNYHFRKVFD